MKPLVVGAPSANVLFNNLFMPFAKGAFIVRFTGNYFGTMMVKLS